MPLKQKQAQLTEIICACFEVPKFISVPVTFSVRVEPPLQSIYIICIFHNSYFVFECHFRLIVQPANLLSGLQFAEQTLLLLKSYSHPSKVTSILAYFASRSLCEFATSNNAELDKVQRLHPLAAR